MTIPDRSTEGLDTDEGDLAEVDMHAVPASTTRTGGRAMSVVGAVCAVIAPVAWVFGLVGMVLGALAHAKSDRFGLPVAGLSAVTMIVGMVVLSLAVT